MTCKPNSVATPEKSALIASPDYPFSAGLSRQALDSHPIRKRDQIGCLVLLISARSHPGLVPLLEVISAYGTACPQHAGLQMGIQQRGSVGITKHDTCAHRQLFSLSPETNISPSPTVTCSRHGSGTHGLLPLCRRREGRCPGGAAGQTARWQNLGGDPGQGDRRAMASSQRGGETGLQGPSCSKGSG